VHLEKEGGEEKWRVVAHSTVDGQVIDDVFDAVVVANGHYSTPFVPDIKNIREFHQAHPSTIIHSKNYHSVDAFRDKKTVVVGNGPSGLDIAYQINQVSKGQTILSVRHDTPLEKLQHTGCREIAEIDEFLVLERAARLKDGSVETDIDAIVFCTGFRYSLPFLNNLERDVITNGLCVHGLYKHLFYIQHPTIVFPILNMRIVPFPVSEAQAAVFSAVWANHLPLPPKPEMQRWNKEAEEAAGDKLHIMPNGQDGVYLNELHDWAMTASTRGKEPPKWSDEQFWIRSVFADAKRAFEEQGCKATTLEELGFKYAPEIDE
jgi:cation diffusion facilitator CzcD-associated flavoprotein CzcO